MCIRDRFFGVLILIVAFITSGWTRFVFFPRIASETALGSVTMPVGTSFDVVDSYVEKMSNSAKLLQDKYRDEQGQSLILNTLAITSEEKGRVRFEILAADKNTTGIGTAQLVKEWRELIGPLPGAESVTFRAELGRGGDPIDVQLSATDLKTLKLVSDEVKNRIRTYPTAFEIADSLSNGKEELQIQLTAQGYAMGMNNTWAVSYTHLTLPTKRIV